MVVLGKTYTANAMRPLPGFLLLCASYGVTAIVHGFAPVDERADGLCVSCRLLKHRGVGPVRDSFSCHDLPAGRGGRAQQFVSRRAALWDGADRSPRHLPACPRERRPFYVLFHGVCSMVCVPPVRAHVA